MRCVGGQVASVRARCGARDAHANAITLKVIRFISHASLGCGARKNERGADREDNSHSAPRARDVSLAALESASADEEPRLTPGSGSLEIRPRWSRDYHNRDSQSGQQRNGFHQHLTNSLCVRDAFHRRATNCQNNCTPGSRAHRSGSHPIEKYFRNAPESRSELISDRDSFRALYAMRYARLAKERTM